MAEMHFQWPSRKQEKAISTQFYEHLLLTPLATTGLAISICCRAEDASSILQM